MSQDPVVLVVSNDDSPELGMLKGVACTIGKTVDEFAEAVPKASVIFHWSGPRELLRQVFLAAPHVKWVHSRNAGVDAVLFPELVESDVTLTNGSGVFSDSLGEFALTAILYFAKDLKRMIRNQEAGRWEPFLVEEIAGQTLGIVGYGSIGRAAAVRAKAMGMKIHALRSSKTKAGRGNNDAIAADAIVDRYYARSEMNAMLGGCDYVVAATPLTPETRHMISDAAFAAMKPTGVFINIGRGPVVDQAALVRALEQKKIKGAALDVFEQEPIPAGDPVYKLDNLLVSPHTADRTTVWLHNAMQFFLAQYSRFSKGEPLENVVNKKLGY